MSLAMIPASFPEEILNPVRVKAPWLQASMQGLSAQLRHNEKSNFTESGSAVALWYGQAFTQLKQVLHLKSTYRSCSIGEWDSGLQHQEHLSGQPLKNTSVRIPGPSCTAKCWISNNLPSSIL